MNCETARGQLQDFDDDGLAPGARAALAEHLLGCPPCRRELNEQRRVRRLLRQMPREPMPVFLKRRLLAALDLPPDPFRSHTAPFPS